VSAGARSRALLANGVAPRRLSEAVLERSDDPTLDLDPDALFTLAWREYADRALRIPASRSAPRGACSAARPARAAGRSSPSSPPRCPPHCSTGAG
jgi:hypothetical protein